MDRVDKLRAFNRLYTRELGLLTRSYLGSGLGVTEVRILYDLAHERSRDARRLAASLGVDEGYLSRVLKGFERRGWIRRVADADDARRRVIQVTRAGHAALVPFEARSRAEIAARLDRLGEEATTRLLAGTDAIRTALGDTSGGAGTAAVTFTDLEPGDAGWIISRHGALYARDEAYTLAFEGLVARIVADFIATRDAARERVWVARLNGERVGSIFCVRDDDQTARLRLFLLEPHARGTGLGRHMLDLCVEFARACGYLRIVLWTHESHRAACALYAARGFRMIGQAAGEAFGQQVVDQTWELALVDGTSIERTSHRMGSGVSISAGKPTRRLRYA